MDEKKKSKGQVISLIGTLIICIGLFLNGFEVISNSIFRVITIVGIIIQGVAIAFIIKKGEL